MNDADPHDEIERLEALIEELAARREGCRKFILVGQIALAVGAVLLVATFLGAIRFDPRILLAGIAAVLGGFIAWGTNISTANEAAAELAEAEAERATLIGQIHLHVVSERPTLH